MIREQWPSPVWRLATFRTSTPTAPDASRGPDRDRCALAGVRTWNPRRPLCDRISEGQHRTREYGRGCGRLMTTALALEHRLLPPMANFESPNPVIPLPIAPSTSRRRWNPGSRTAGPHRGCQLIWDGWHERACGARGAAARPTSDSIPDDSLLLVSARTAGARSGDNAPRRLALESPRGVTRRRRLHASGRPASLPHRRFVVCRSVEEGVAALRQPWRSQSSLASTKPASAPLPSCSPGRCAIRRDGTRPIRTGT